MYTRRLNREFTEICDNPVKHCNVTQVDLRNWNIEISDKNNNTYNLTVQFPEKFPFVPPIIVIKENINHHKVDKDGKILIDILRKEMSWSPGLNMITILSEICQLINDNNDKKS